MKSCEINRKGKIRKIIILNNEEKRVRKNLKQLMENEIQTAPYVYSFVKGRSAKQAAQLIKNNIDNYKYFIKYDLSDFYNSIDICLLRQIIERKTEGKYLLNGLDKLLKEECDILKIKGLAMGSPLNNYLSNIYLYDFDMKYGTNENNIYVRFCDDIMILTDDRESIKNIEQDLQKYNLNINKAKSLSGSYGDSVIFLGKKIIKKSQNLNETMPLKECIMQGLNSDDENEKKIIEDKVKEYGEAAVYVYKIIVYGDDYDAIIQILIENLKYSVIEEVNSYMEEFNDENSAENKILKIFSIRQRGYYISKVEGKKEYEYADKIFDLNILRKHIKGEVSIAVDIVREDDKSNIAVFDIDSEDEDITKIEKALADNNIVFYKEISGQKGFHYWIFWDQYYSVKDIERYLRNLKEKYFNQIKLEIMPKAECLDKLENVIKVPFGKHPVTKKKSSFVGADFISETIYNELPADESSYFNFINKFRSDYPEGYKLIENCNIISWIIKNSIIEKKMSHYKRLLILYTFKFLKDGEKMIHTIMQEMDNYSFNITENHISNSLENPVSCAKIRKYISDDDQNILCRCSEKNNLTPLVKIDSQKYSNITIEENIKKVLKELVELKEERKRIDKKINVLQSKMEKLYEQNDKREIKVESGNLKKENNKWIIELEI